MPDLHGIMIVVFRANSWCEDMLYNIYPPTMQTSHTVIF